jgi:hypothetical protein
MSAVSCQTNTHPRRNLVADTEPDFIFDFDLDIVEQPSHGSPAVPVGVVCTPSKLPCPHPPRRKSQSDPYLVPVAAPRRAGRPCAPRRASRSWRGSALPPRPTRSGAELRQRRRRAWGMQRRSPCLWDTSDSTGWRGVWKNLKSPPFGMCLVIASGASNGPAVVESFDLSATWIPGLPLGPESARATVAIVHCRRCRRPPPTGA